MKRAAFWLLVLISLPYRLYHISYPLLDVHSFRQTQTATVARNMYLHGINFAQTQLDIFGTGKERYLTLEFPLYEAMVAVLYKLFFVADIWGRVITIVSGYVAAWYIYQICMLLFNKKTIALVSVFFFLFAPLNLFYQRAFLIEPLIISCLLAGMYYFFLWRERGGKYVLFVSCLLFSLGCLQKGLYGFFWVFPLLSYGYFRRTWKQWFSLPVLSYLSVLLFVMILWQHHEDAINLAAGHGYFTSSNIGQREWNFGTWADRISWEMWQPRLKQLLDGMLMKPGVILFCIGFFVVWKKKNGWVLGIWVLSQALYFFTLFRIQSHTYYQLVMVPAVAICMAVGLVWAGAYLQRLFHLNPAYSLSVVLAWFAFRTWTAALGSFPVNMAWYGDLQALNHLLPPQQAGVLLMPTNDWNSVYTYYPGRTMLLVPTANIPENAPGTWKQSGYSFLLLYPFRDVLLPVKGKLRLEETTDYPGTKQGDFQILRFK